MSAQKSKGRQSGDGQAAQVRGLLGGTVGPGRASVWALAEALVARWDAGWARELVRRAETGHGEEGEVVAVIGGVAHAIDGQGRARCGEAPAAGWTVTRASKRARCGRCATG
jgi:hypothetical protein